MPVSVLKVHWSAFTVACFTGLSGVHEYLGGHQNALAGLNRKPTGWEWPHDSTVMLTMDLARICSTIGPHLGPLT